MNKTLLFCKCFVQWCPAGSILRSFGEEVSGTESHKSSSRFQAHRKPGLGVVTFQFWGSNDMSADVATTPWVELGSVLQTCDKAYSLPASGRRHLGDTLGLGKELEFLSDWKGTAGDVGDFLGLHKSPLCSFHSSSSFSMERRLLTFDSFSKDSCRTACSVESCL